MNRIKINLNSVCSHVKFKPKAKVKISQIKHPYFSKETMESINFAVSEYKPSSKINYKIAAAFDKAIASIGIVLSAPLMAVIGSAIKLESHGPAIIAQNRIGKNGKIFKMYKFRTMAKNSENSTLINGKNDVRITHVGKIIRKYSLDEIPQLFNIIKGDMSFVGPRANYWGDVEKNLVDKKININNKEYNYISRYCRKPGFIVPSGYGKAKKLDGLGMDIEKFANLKMENEAPFVTNWTLSQYFKGIYQAVKKVVSGRNC